MTTTRLDLAPDANQFAAWSRLVWLYDIIICDEWLHSWALNQYPSLFIIRHTGYSSTSTSACCPYGIVLCTRILFLLIINLCTRYST